MKTKYLRLSKKAASRGIHRQHKHGAVLVNGNRVLAIGFNNSGKTHPTMPWPKGIHAESAAIHRAQQARLSTVGSTLYVVRENSNHKPGMSRPCKSCHAILVKAGVKNVFFTQADGTIGELKLLS